MALQVGSWTLAHLLSDGSDLQVRVAGSSPRLLLSDKQLKLWCILSSASVARFQADYPEFGPSLTKLQVLTGGIVLPIRFELRVQSQLQEFELYIDEFEVRQAAKW